MGHDNFDTATREEHRINPPNELPPKPTHCVAAWTPFFIGVVIFVGGVSAYDGYLVVRTGPAIRDFEKNPIGRYLIECDDGNPDIFLRVKAAGTLLSLVGLALLHRHSSRLAGPVELALVAFQGGLLFFLENPFS